MQLARSPWGRLLAAFSLLVAGTGSAAAAPKATDAQIVALMEQHGYVALKLLNGTGTIIDAFPALEIKLDQSSRRSFALIDSLATQSLVRAKSVTALGLKTRSSGEFLSPTALKTKAHGFAEVPLKQADWPLEVQVLRSVDSIQLGWLRQYQDTTIRDLRVDFVLGIDFLKRQQAVLDVWGGLLFVPRENDAPSPTLQNALAQQGFIPVRPVDVRDPRMLLPLKTRNVSGQFVLGTACQWTCLHLDVAHRLAKDTSREDLVFVQIEKPNLKSRRVRIFDLLLGAWSENTCTMGSLDLSDWGIGDETNPITPAIGILGVDLLRTSTALVDFGGGQLYIPKEPRKRR